MDIGYEMTPINSVDDVSNCSGRNSINSRDGSLLSKDAVVACSDLQNVVVGEPSVSVMFSVS